MEVVALGGGREANRIVLARASGFCLQQGRVSVILDVRPDGDPSTPYYPTAFDVTFRCLTTAQTTAAGLPHVGTSPDLRISPMPRS